MRFRKDKCSQTRGLLSAYMDQQLGLQEQEGVERHLKACQGCRQELDSLRGTVRLLHRVPQVSPARSFVVTEVKPLPRWSPFPVLRTATAVVAVFLVLVFALDVVNVFETGPTSVEEGRTYSDERAPEEKGPGSEPSTAATGEGTLGEEEAGWVRPLEYGLLGVAVVLGGMTTATWRKRKKVRAT